MLQDLKDLLKDCENDPHDFYQKNELKDIKVKCHPDKWLDNQDEARVIFDRFVQIHEELQNLGSSGKYTLIKKLADGDISTVFVGKLDKNYILKIPKVKNSLLKKEFETLLSLYEDNVFSKLIQKPVDFSNGIGVYEYYNNIISGREVMGYPSLDSRHIVWMFKRALMVLGYVHNKGAVHGAMTPDHILFNKENHGMILCGWIHSGKIGDDIKVVPAKWKHYYDNFKKTKKLSKQLDIYMTAKSMLDIGKNIHPRLLAFINACMLPGNMAPENAWDLHDELKELSINIFGKSKFIELKNE